MKQMIAVVVGRGDSINKDDRILIGKNKIRKIVRVGERGGLYVKSNGGRLYVSQMEIVQKVK